MNLFDSFTPLVQVILFSFGILAISAQLIFKGKSSHIDQQVALEKTVTLFKNLSDY